MSRTGWLCIYCLVYFYFRAIRLCDSSIVHHGGHKLHIHLFLGYFLRHNPK